MWKHWILMLYFSNIGLAVSIIILLKKSKTQFWVTKYDPYFVAICFIVKEKKI